MTTNGTTLNDTSLGCYAQGTEGDLVQCTLDGVMGAGPSPALVGLVMSGVVMTSLYIAGNGTVIVPAVVTILLGSVLVPLLPAQYVPLAYTVVVIGITAAAFSAYTRYTHRGGF